MSKQSLWFSKVVLPSFSSNAAVRIDCARHFKRDKVTERLGSRKGAAKNAKKEVLAYSAQNKFVSGE